MLSLQRFSVPTYKQFCISQGLGTSTHFATPALTNGSNRNLDPCEIDIDVDTTKHISVVNTSNITIESAKTPIFDDYGMGCLEGHPLIISTFGQYLQISDTTLVRQQDVLWHLKEYLLACGRESKDKPDAFSVDEFASYLREVVYEGIEDLACVGLVLQGDLYQQIAILKSIVREQFRVESEKLREDLQALQQSNSASRQTTNAKAMTVVKCVPILAPPKSNSRLLSLLERCKNKVMKDGDNSFSPSMKKIRDCLMDMTRRQSNHSDTHQLKRQKKDKAPDICDGNVMDEIIEATSEYIFLHIGSKRDVAKRYEKEEVADVDSDKDGEQETKEDQTLDINGDNDKENTTIHDHHDIDQLSSRGCGKVVLPASDSKSIDVVDNDVTENSFNGRFTHHLTSSSSSMAFKQSMSAIDSKMTLSLANSISQDPVIASLIEIIPGDKLVPLIDSIKHILPPQSTTNTEFDTKSIGKFGEALVYQYLQNTLSIKETESIKWLNENDETKASYDLVLTTSSKVNKGKANTTFIEVKSTRFPDRNVFDLSWWEWIFATSLPKVNYHIYRVYGISPVYGSNHSITFDSTKLKIVIIKDIEELIKLGRIKLCLAI